MNNLPKRFSAGSESQIKVQTVVGSLLLIGWSENKVLANVSTEETLTSKQEKDKLEVMLCWSYLKKFMQNT